MKAKEPTRLIDVNGFVITDPPHYHESLKWGREMIDQMESDNVDRSGEFTDHPEDVEWSDVICESCGNCVAG